MDAQVKKGCSIRNSGAGFSIVELIVVTAILGIVFAIAVPSFSQMIESQRVKNAANDIYLSLSLARSTAVRLNQNVTLAPNSGTSDWSAGWQIANPLHPTSPIETHNAITSMSVLGPDSVVFRTSGRVLITGTATKFTITGNSTGLTRYICIDLSGRSKVTTASTC